MNRYFSIVLAVLCMLSCKSENGEFVFERQYLSNSQLPALVSNTKGDLYHTEVEMEDGVNLLSVNKIEGEEITLNRLIAAGQDWFVNWADYPGAQIFPDGENIFVHWLEKSGEGSYDYDIKFKLYHIPSDSSTQAIKLNDSKVHGEYGFVSSTPYRDGIQLVWLDGRNSKHGAGDHPAMSLRTSFLDAEGVVSPSVELDARVCDCCQTAIVAEGEKLYVQYRDRSDKEIRDISMIVYDGAWSKPIDFSKDNWTIAGCPVNGPVMDINNGMLASAWYTQDGETPKSYVSFYDSETKSEKNRFLISEKNSLGRLDIALINSEELLVSYMESEEEYAHIIIAYVDIHNGVKHKYVLAKNTSARSSGFPEIEIVADKVYYSYYDDLKSKEVIIGYVKLNTLINN